MGIVDWFASEIGFWFVRVEGRKKKGILLAEEEGVVLNSGELVLMGWLLLRIGVAIWGGWWGRRGVERTSGWRVGGP